MRREMEEPSGRESRLRIEPGSSDRQATVLVHGLLLPISVDLFSLIV